MSNKSNTFESDFLKHLFQNLPISNIGDASGLPASATEGNFYVRLYTDAVEVTETVIGTECAYTGYVAGGVAVPRNASNWSVAASVVSNVNAITFGACTLGTETAKYFAVWKDNVSSAEADRLFWGVITNELSIVVGITPNFGAGTISGTEN